MKRCRVVARPGVDVLVERVLRQEKDRATGDHHVRERRRRRRVWIVVLECGRRVRTTRSRARLQSLPCDCQVPGGAETRHR